MEPAAIFALALGLAMDATAVAAARGLAAPAIRPRDVALVAGAFGGAQALMPLVGYGLGHELGPLVAAWDHWIAFVLLGGLGAKMIHEALTHDEDDAPAGDVFALGVVLTLAVATSIDALAVGLTLPMLGAPLVGSVLTIGAVTAVCSALGLFAGRRFGARLGRRLDVLGGLVLIALGAKILVEHLSTG